jgi:hypothetical protein
MKAEEESKVNNELAGGCCVKKHYIYCRKTGREKKVMNFSRRCLLALLV